MRSGCRPRIFRLPLRGLSVGLVLAAGVGTAFGTTDGEAVAACEQALRAEGASAIQEVEVRREDRVPFVHGIADFNGAERMRVRCRVYNGEVTSIRYLVRSASVSEGWLWTSKRPGDAGQAGGRPDETASPQAEPQQDGAAVRPDGQADEAAAGPPQPPEPVAPRWRSAGETDFGGAESVTPSPSSDSVSPIFLRPPG